MTSHLQHNQLLHSHYAVFHSLPLPRILHLGYPRVSVLPQVEEFLVVFDGFGFPSLFLVCGLFFQTHFFKQSLKP